MLYAGGSSSFIIVIIVLGGAVFVVVRILMTVTDKIKGVTGKRENAYAAGGKREEAPITQSMAPEDIYHTKIYNRKEKIPADAMQRSAYIAWLVRQGHYEEADRVSSLNI